MLVDNALTKVHSLLSLLSPSVPLIFSPLETDSATHAAPSAPLQQYPTVLTSQMYGRLQPSYDCEKLPKE